LHVVLQWSPTDWRYVFVADSSVQICHVIRKFIRCRNAKTRTVSAKKNTACYALAVLVCPCVSVKLHFHIKLVIRFIFFSVCVARVLACFNFFFKDGEKIFEILSGLGQTHSLASFGLSLGLCGLIPKKSGCVAAGLA